MIADAGEHATRRFLEFFAATIRNRNTRTAYLHAVGRFFAWCERHKLGELADIEPLHVAAYIEAIGKDFEKPTVKQHLAAIRMLFDWLVTGRVSPPTRRMPFAARSMWSRRGKKTVLTPDQARALLDSIDTSTLVGLRDRALISVMTYRLRPHRRRRWHARQGLLRQRQALVGPPARERRQAPRNAGASEAGAYPRRVHQGGWHPRRRQSPLFRSAAGRTGALTEKPMNRIDAWRMIQRRAADLGAPVKIGCHTFRATGITAYLEAGATLENAQAMAAHESPRTTKLYDRTGDEITLDEVERITI